MSRSAITALTLVCHMPVMTFLADIFFFNDTATTEIYTLSLHDALPILPRGADGVGGRRAVAKRGARAVGIEIDAPHLAQRSEEHTSELQSHSDLVCRLLLEKKKKKNEKNKTNKNS